MSPSRTLGALVAVLASPACVTPRPAVAPTAKPAAAAAYVGGFFARSEGHGFALGIVNSETGREYVIPFERERRTGDDTGGHAVVIEVPPGGYHVASWMTYGTATMGRATEKEVSATHPLARPFRVSGGEVVLLGSIEASTASGSTIVHWRIQPRRVTEDAVVAAFRQAYPGFKDAPTTCLVCVRETIPAKLDLQLKPPTLDAPPAGR